MLENLKCLKPSTHPNGNLLRVSYVDVTVYLFFFKDFYLFERESEREQDRARAAGRGRSRLPTELGTLDVGLDPRTAGSRPEPRQTQLTEPSRRATHPPPLFTVL